MVRNIVHNGVFRIFTPIFYGVAMYILILLVFDRVQDLSENFLLVEVVLCLIITYVLFELLRFFMLQFEKRISSDWSMSKRISVQLGLSLVISVAITSFIISFYFSKLVGFNSYRSELIVFNAIFIITTLLYNMVYFSFYYLNKTNVSMLKREDIRRKGVEIELDTYKNKINPVFLYNSLETLISLTKNTDKAEEFILKLSDIYRNILSGKSSECVLLKDELQLASTLTDILNYKLGNNLDFNFNEDLIKSNDQIISGTLVVVFEDIVNRTIISGLEPLTIKLQMDNDFLLISHPRRNKLIQEFSKQNELEHLKKAYQKLGDGYLIITDEFDDRIYKVPILKVEDKE